jgi:tRNA/rRNA methyltransferase
LIAQAARLRVIVKDLLFPANMGSIARICTNFAIAELYFVTPKCSPDDPLAQRSAVHARPLLAAAAIVPALAEAAKDCHWLWAAGDHSVAGKATTELTQLALPVGYAGLRIGLLFGAEGNGLTRADVAACDTILRIPLPGNPVLNIAQAMAIILWQLSQSDKAVSPIHLPPGKRDQRTRLLNEYRQRLEWQGRSETVIKRKTQHLQQLLAATAMTGQWPTIEELVRQMRTDRSA